MTLWRRWLQQPQTVWARRALFQVHVWTGIAIGLYVSLISLSGSILVFRVELSNAFAPGPRIVTASGPRLDQTALEAAARRAHPEHTVAQIWEPKTPEQAVEVTLTRDGERTVRLFDPYRGEDLGPAVPLGLRVLRTLLDFHDTLMFGDSGKRANAFGGLLTAVLCLTGLVIWWPGVSRWFKSLTLPRAVSWKRFAWNLHSAIGFWSVAFLLMWGVTGLYLGYQEPFMNLVDYLEPFDEVNFTVRRGDEVLTWLGRLHFGRYGGMPMKIGWAIVGLAPAGLFVTGVVMWWNRVLRGVAARGV